MDVNAIRKVSHKLRRIQNIQKDVKKALDVIRSERVTLQREEKHLMDYAEELKKEATQMESMLEKHKKYLSGLSYLYKKELDKSEKQIKELEEKMSSLYRQCLQSTAQDKEESHCPSLA